MNLIKFNPFMPAPTKGLSSFVEELFDRSISDFMGGDFFLNQPSVNIVELPDHYRMEIAAPGWTKKDFNVSASGEFLVVSAKKETNDTVKDERFLRREFNFTSFERRFQLPENVAFEKIGAKYENGILSITLPKNEEVRATLSRVIELK